MQQDEFELSTLRVRLKIGRSHLGEQRGELERQEFQEEHEIPRDSVQRGISLSERPEPVPLSCKDIHGQQSGGLVRFCL